MRLILLDYGLWNAVHLSKRTFLDDEKDTPYCGGGSNKRTPKIVEVESTEFFPGNMCARCLQRLSTVEFSKNPTNFRPWAKAVVNPMTEAIMDEIEDLEILDMTILPEQSRYARAVFSIQVGPFEFHNCFVLGDAGMSPLHYSVSLPGKRLGDTHRSKWRNLVVVKDSFLMEFIKTKALTAYVRAIDSHIAKESEKLIGVDYSLLVDE